MATPVKVDVYFDYACPWSWGGSAWIEQVRAELGDGLEVTYRIFPLEQVNAKVEGYKVWEQPNDGTSSTLRSFQGFWAAQQQGVELATKFNLALYEKRHVDGRNLSKQEVLEDAATSAGLDLEKFREDLKSDAVLGQIEKDFTYGNETLGVFGTPTFVFENDLGAYLKVNFRELPKDPVKFFEEFTAIVRDRPEAIEIKRPDTPRH